MLCNQNIRYILIVLFIPMQYSFQTDYFSNALPLMQSEWKTNNIPQFEIELSKNIIKCSAIICGICSIFIYYKIKKRKLAISIAFIINSLIYLCYLCVDENRFWVSIILRIFNGILLGFLNSITILYLYHFPNNNCLSFFGYLIQTVMFLSLVIMSLLLTVLNWRYLGVILAVQCLIISGLIFIVPDFSVPPKKITHDYIYQNQHRKNIFILFFIMLLQQFSGIGMAVNNVPKMLTGIGLEINPHMQKALMNMIGCVTTFIGAYASVTIPLNYMWAISSFGMSVALIIYGLTLKIKTANWIGTFGDFLFFLFYGLGQGPIPWLLCGELFSESVRIESGAITTVFNTALGLIFTFIIDNIQKSFGEFGSVIFNASMDFIAMFIGLFLIPCNKKYNIENDNLM